MKRTSIIVATLVFIALTGVAAINVLSGANSGNAAQSQSVAKAGVQTVTFTVEKMTCAACPITVRKAMENVAGVRSVNVDFSAKTATVRFDPDVTTAKQIGAAATDAGYPAAPHVVKHD